MLWYPWVGWLLGFLILWRIPLVRRTPAGSPGRRVSVIIPARNEEAALGRLLASLFAQKSGADEVWVVDDHSSDGTAELAQRAGARVLAAPELPAGWLGKPWACLQGARAASGDVLVFLDADTWLEEDGLAALVAAQEESGGLVSVQPDHRMERGVERLAAFFNLITLAGLGSFTLLGERVRPSGGFGPCLVCARDDYFRVGGHARGRADVVEGIPVGRAFQEAGLPVTNLGGRGVLCFRMYADGLGQMVGGLAKSFASGSRAVPAWLLAAIILWVAGGVSVTRNLVSVSLAGAETLPLWIALDLAYAVQLRRLLARIGNFGWWPALLFQLPLAFFLGVFGLSLVQTLGRRRVRWKGRDVALD